MLRSGIGQIFATVLLILGGDQDGVYLHRPSRKRFLTFRMKFFNIPSGHFRKHLLVIQFPTYAGDEMKNHDFTMSERLVLLCFNRSFMIANVPGQSISNSLVCKTVGLEGAGTECHLFVLQCEQNATWSIQNGR